MDVMCQIYCSSMEEKIKFSFKMYDFDEDNSISQEDARLILSYIPIGTIDVSFVI